MRPCPSISCWSQRRTFCVGGRSATRRSPTRALVVGHFTHQNQAAPAEQEQAVHHVQQAEKALGPYLLWDKALKLQAVFDARSCSQADLNAVTQLLEEHAVEAITVDTTRGTQGQQLTVLTVVCKPDDGDQVAAALLQLTPATRISATSCEQCYLPQHKLSVSTPYGTVDVSLSLAGSKVCKLTPDWQQCEQAAAAAATAAGAANAAEGDCTVDAATVAAAAVAQLQAGLDDGSIDLGMQYLF